MSKLLLHFPNDDLPRNSQAAILTGVEEAISSGKKFIIVQAPTGSGKSHVAATLSNYSNPPSSDFVSLVESHEIFDKNNVGEYKYKDVLSSQKPFGCAVLTVTKMLQDQYKSLFNEAVVLKGKQNYPCAVDDEFDCDLGPCFISKKLQTKCKDNDTCLYLNARAESLVSKFSVQNYSVFFNLPEHVKQRQFLVCDEASELEDELVGFYSCTIEYEKINVKQFGLDKLSTEDTSYVYKWICDLAYGLKDEIDKLMDAIQRIKGRNDSRMKLVFKVRFYKNLLERLVIITRNWYKAEYIVEFDKDRCTFTPLYVNMLAQDFFRMGKTVILMSGTIIDHEMFAKTLGIDDYKYIEVDSDFDPKNSPVYCSKKVSVNHGNIDKVMPDLVKFAVELCKKHCNDNGIIHTHTMKTTKMFQNIIGNDKRYLFRDETMTNEELLKEHFIRQDKTVLISPSLGFGTDLHGDFGRFQIIMKAPYLPLGSKRISILFKRNPRWYQMKALIILVQMCGRTTRSKEDHSETYILDGSAINLIRHNVNRLPRWFCNRLV
jgi:ATP-dependent DNA helicase DinG